MPGRESARLKGNQVKILNNPVTVNREKERITIVQKHEKDVRTMNCKSGNLLKS